MHQNLWSDKLFILLIKFFQVQMRIDKNPYRAFGGLPPYIDGNNKRR